MRGPTGRGPQGGDHPSMRGGEENRSRGNRGAGGDQQEGGGITGRGEDGVGGRRGAAGVRELVLESNVCQEKS